MRKSKRLFKWIYLIYLLVLIVLVAASAVYVRSVLAEYEANQPEYQAEKALQQLLTDASTPQAFWEKYSMPEVADSVYEKGTDVKSAYINLYTDGELDYAVKNGTYAEDELHYIIRNGKLQLAEVILKAAGPAQTKLAVFTSRVWDISEVKPIFEPKEYNVQVPDDFSVSANGVALLKEDGTAADNGEIKYTVSGVYMEPTFAISDNSGNNVSYVIKNNRVIPEYYNYSLTLPHTLQVTVNGAVSEGTVQPDGTVLHDIKLLQKPEVIISDLYGNAVSYEGKELPMTYITILAPEDYTVKLDGASVPESAVTVGDIPEYEILADLLDDLPVQCEYNIAILKENAEISVSDPDGNAVELNAGEKHHDLMGRNSLDSVPAEVSGNVDVLEVAQNWSLYMSNDYSFRELAKSMLKGSYQYKVAEKYYNSVDRTFFSKHTLLDPIFTGNDVRNFTWITDDCFSVDISFVKHMRLATNQLVDDSMNDRFYFIRSNDEWLLAAMKEVSADE